MPLIPDLFSDLEPLLAPLAGDSPAGIDLDGTLELNALELKSAEPEDAVVAGVERNDERNWLEIRRQTEALLATSKDLRVAGLLARSLLHCEGLPGFCAGVRFMCELTQRYWDVIYPALDPEDGDAVTRLNALQELVSAPALAQLRVAPMFGNDRSLRTTANDLLLATSHPLGKPGLSELPSHMVFSALEALGPSALQEHVALLADTRGRLSALLDFVFDKTGAKLQIGAIIKTEARGAPGLLDGLHQALSDETTRLAKDKAPKAAVAADSSDSEPRSNGGGEISRREDVVRMIERICGYYVRVEPSSPVPLLLQRAKRLVTMDFVEIVRDLADQGLPQLGTVAGIAIPGVGGAQNEEEEY
ncbi:MAG TPA: type VI secretion system ImpA family N-terminal domain-containing protein [Polyangiaceae bacterium]|nr:type VI secretion system ImpA family N-terminal domain-containing protein [Polyangiaceae bacterium]